LKTVLTDNWNIESALIYYEAKIANNNERFHDADTYMSWYSFLTMLVMWDKILYHKNHLSLFWQGIISYADTEPLNKLKSFLQEIDMDKNPCDKYLDSSSNSYEPIDIGKSDTPEGFSEYLYGYLLQVPEQSYSTITVEEDIVSQGALRYLFLSNQLGVSYVPHPRRSQYLIDNKMIWNNFSRLDILNKIDREMSEYYRLLNEKLGRNLYKFQYPLFYDYLRKNAKTIEEELQLALSLREDKDVKCFRESIETVENNVNSGNTQSLLVALEATSTITKEITQKYKKEIVIGELTIGLTPSINIPLKFSKSEKTYHTTFLQKLADFGVNDRTRKHL